MGREGELDDLLIRLTKLANQVMEMLPPEERERIRRENLIKGIYGNLALDHPNDHPSLAEVRRYLERHWAEEKKDCSGSRPSS